MRYEQKPHAFNILSGLALGIALGASLGILLSLDRRPPASERVRHRLRKAGTGAGHKVRRVAGEIADRVPSRVTDLF